MNQPITSLPHMSLIFIPPDRSYFQQALSQHFSCLSFKQLCYLRLYIQANSKYLKMIVYL
jgi:hypothetical protein